MYDHRVSPSFAYLITKKKKKPKKERKKERKKFNNNKKVSTYTSRNNDIFPSPFSSQNLSINDLYSRDQATEADISRLRKSIQGYIYRTFRFALSPRRVIRDLWVAAQTQTDIRFSITSSGVEGGEERPTPRQVDTRLIKHLITRTRLNRTSLHAQSMAIPPSHPPPSGARSGETLFLSGQGGREGRGNKSAIG